MKKNQVPIPTGGGTYHIIDGKPVQVRAPNSAKERAIKAAKPSEAGNKVKTETK